MNHSVGHRLEQYTRQRPQEVLIVTAEVAGERDQIAIFKGFSSSLMQATAFDPDIPVLPDSARIISIDRVKSPYNPQNVVYLERELTWDSIQPLLSEAGV